MSVKDLTQYLTPGLELKWGERTFTVPPPTKDVGLKLAAINAAGVAAYLAVEDACPTCGRAGAPGDLPEETLELLDAIKGQDLGELSLGPAYRDMIDAGVPGPHIDQFALYALYYWVMGETTADQILEAQHEAQRGGGASGEARRSTPKPGRHTGSAPRTKKGSTRGTGESRKN